MAISEGTIQQRLKLRRLNDGQMEIFQRFVEASGQALGMADLEGKIFFANTSLCRLLAREHPEDLYEGNLIDCYAFESAMRLRDEILPLIKQEGQWTGELALRDLNDRIISTIDNIFLLRTDEGKPVCFAVVITDISERIRMEEELHTYRTHLEYLVSIRTAELEKTNALLRAQIAERELAEAERLRLAAVLESTTDLVAITEPDGRINYVNKAGRRIVGWEGEKKEDILKHNLVEVHPAWALRIVKEEGIPAAVQEGVWRGETAILKPDGQEVPISQVIIAHRGADGEINYLSTIMRDISKRKQTEEALRENDASIRRIIDNSPLGAHTYKLEDDGRLIFMGANPSADHILKTNHSFFIGMTIEEAFPLLDTEIFEKYRDVARTGLHWVKDIISYDGGAVAGAFAVFAFRTGPNQMTAFFYDITERKRAEEALKNSERILKDTQRLAKVGGWEFDVQRQNMTWTDETYRIHDYDAGTFMPGSMDHAARSLECYPGEVRPLIEEAFRRCVEYGEAYDLELPFMTAKGRRLWIRTTAEAIMENEKVIKVYGNIQDITERKQAEDSLRESEQRFRGLTEAMTQHAWIVDVERKKYYHNPQSVNYTGFAVETAADMWQVVHPDDKPFVRLKWREAMPSSDHLIEYMYRRRRHDGIYRWFLSRCVLMRDEQNKLQWIFGVDTDIDDLKRAEQALQDNLMLLAEAERMGHTGSWKADIEMKNISVSDEIRRIYGISEDEDVTLKTFTSRIHPEDRINMIEKWRTAIEKKTPFAAEYRIVLPDGTVRHLFRSSEVISDFQGNPVGIHGTVQDVTEKKMLEDEMIKAQKLESIGTLAGGLAHDYNNLLTTIMGSLEMIKMNLDKSNRIYPTVMSAEEAVMTARDLTRQLITFSRGGHPMSRIMSIKNILTETVRLALKGAVTQVELKIANDLPKANIDENQISQVIYNIVMNAREAMAQKGKLVIEANKATLEADNALHLKEGVYVRITFRDQGPGIRAEHISKLFDPYFSTKEVGKQKGMGLGLPICYSIMKKHNGHIQIDSREGIGTTVILHIPAVRK